MLRKWDGERYKVSPLIIRRLATKELKIYSGLGCNYLFTDRCAWTMRLGDQWRTSEMHSIYAESVIGRADSFALKDMDADRPNSSTRLASGHQAAQEDMPGSDLLHHWPCMCCKSIFWSMPFSYKNWGEWKKMRTLVSRLLDCARDLF